MKRRRWIPAYWCDKNKLNILKKIFFCKELIDDVKCIGCKYRMEEKIKPK
jgi:hypothetical protein